MARWRWIHPTWRGVVAGILASLGVYHLGHLVDVPPWVTIFVAGMTAGTVTKWTSSGR